jgi:hypothetical protein
MSRKNSLYIVMWEHSIGLDTGFLPFGCIPRGVLRNAIFDTNDVLEVRQHGIMGIYEKKKLALEHMRLEKAWRGDRNRFWIEKISPRETQ